MVVLLRFWLERVVDRERGSPTRARPEAETKNTKIRDIVGLVWMVFVRRVTMISAKDNRCEYEHRGLIVHVQAVVDRTCTTSLSWHCGGENGGRIRAEQKE